MCVGEGGRDQKRKKTEKKTFFFLLFLFVGGSKCVFFSGLNVVTISQHIRRKKHFFGPVSGGTPLWALFSFFSSSFFLLFFFVFFSLFILFCFFLLFFSFPSLPLSPFPLSHLPLFVRAQNLFFFLGLHFVTISLNISFVKNQFLGPSRGGTPLGPLLFFSSFFSLVFCFLFLHFILSFFLLFSPFFIF